MPAKPEISIVLPTHRRLDALALTLESLAVQDLPGPVELIIVCSGPRASQMSPEVEKVAAGHPIPVRVLERTSGGAAGARNAGVDAAQADLILFLNEDTPPASPGLVRGHLVAQSERDDRWRGVMGPCEWHPALETTPVMEWLQRTGKSHDYSGLEREGGQGSVLYANNLSIHREALERVGGFDERFAAYGWAEYDLGLRLADRGFGLAFRPELLVWHYHRHTLADSLRRMEAVGRAANLLNRLHAGRRGLVTPAPRGGRAAAGRALAPLALRAPVPRRTPRPLSDRAFRALHYAVLARGYSRPQLPDDPALRGGLNGHENRRERAAGAATSSASRST